MGDEALVQRHGGEVECWMGEWKKVESWRTGHKYVCEARLAPQPVRGPGIAQSAKTGVKMAVFPVRPDCKCRMCRGSGSKLWAWEFRVASVYSTSSGLHREVTDASEHSHLMERTHDRVEEAMSACEKAAGRLLRSMGDRARLLSSVFRTAVDDPPLAVRHGAVKVYAPPPREGKRP